MVIVNSNLPPEIKAALNKASYNIIPSPVASALPRELAAHPDMLIHSSPWGLVCAPEISAGLNSLGISSISGSADPSEKYPFDIPFNCFSIKGALICNEKYTDPVILRIYREQGAQVLHCNQGYASCSALRLGDAVVTADTSVAAACETAGAQVLLISPGSIRLDGYSYGFIGGCGGLVGDRLLLYGDVATHPDGKRITDLAASLGITVCPLAEGPLTDYGGIIEFNG